MHWVFGDGSDMHVPDLARWLGDKGHAADGILRVEATVMPGYELVWNDFSRVRDGAAANVRARDGAELRGVALHVTPEILGAIDIKEGHPGRYHRGETPIPARVPRAHARGRRHARTRRRLRRSAAPRRHCVSGAAQLKPPQTIGGTRSFQGRACSSCAASR